MTAALKPIGALPSFSVKSAWPVTRLWDITRLRSERGRPELPLLSVFLNRGVIAYGDGGGQVHKPGLDLSIYQVVRRGDFVLNNQQAWRGSVGVSRHEGIISPAYIVLMLGDAIEPRFADYLFQSRDMVAQYVTSSKGVGDIQRDIHTPWLKNVKLAVPPPSEQAAIVRFLDWANGRLERAIRAKRKVIALLGEQKQAIIHRAVTRGLDPAAPLKPSGIAWLGDIPRHWDAPLLGRLITRIEQGWSPVAAEGELAQCQWAVLTLSAVRRGLFDSSAIKPVALTAIIPAGIQVADGDILLTRSNTRDRVGDVCIVRAPRAKTILCDLIYRLRGRPGAFVSEFLVYQLLSRIGRAQIERDARGSSGTMPKISQGHIKSWRVVLPPLEEQKRIVEKIDFDIVPVDAAVTRLEREIELLREYRTRLIADIVTGKLDVREAALLLPEEASPDTTGDDADLIADIDVNDDEASAE